MLRLSAGAIQNHCEAAMLSREAYFDTACGLLCFLMQSPAWRSSTAKKFAGGPSPASLQTPPRKYSRAWDELTPVGQML